MDDLGNAIAALAICLFIVATFVWLTWYVVLWLAGAVALYLIFRQRAKRAAWERETFGGSPLRQSLYEGLRDTLLCAVWGLGLLTVAQLAVNLTHWISGPDGIFEEAVTNALWSGEALVTGLRRLLTAALSPRISFPLLGAAVFLSVCRPDWRPVKRVFGARAWVGRVAKVALVLSSMSFFTSEYASLHETGLVQLRLERLARAHARTVEALQRTLASQWTATQFTQASSSEKAETAALLKAAGASGYGPRIVDAEGERFAQRWSASSESARSPRSEPEVAEGKVTSPPAESAWEVPASRSAGSVLATLRGPTEPWPSPEVVGRAEEQASRVEAQAEEAQVAAVEMAKLSLGALVPDSLEPLLRQFVKVTTDAFAKTAAKKWFDCNDATIKVALAAPGEFARRTASSLKTSLSTALRGDREVADVGSGSSASTPDLEAAPTSHGEAITARVTALATGFKQVEIEQRRAAAAATAKAEAERSFRPEWSPYGHGTARDPMGESFSHERYRSPAEGYGIHPSEHFGGFRGGGRR